MFILNREQYDLVERALDRDPRYTRDDDVSENVYTFREHRNGRIVAIKMTSSPTGLDRMNYGWSYYAAGRVMTLAIDLMLEENDILQD